MGHLDARLADFSVTAPAGQATEVVTTWVDSAGSSVAPGAVSLFIGGTDDDLDDTTGATEVVGVVASNVATFTVAATTTKSQLLRLERDGEMVGVGKYRTSKDGKRTTTTATVLVASDSVTVTVSGGSPEVAADLATLEATVGDLAEPTNTLGMEWTVAAGLARGWPVSHAGALKTSVSNTASETSLLTATKDLAGWTADDLLVVMFEAAVTNDSGGNIDATFRFDIEGSTFLTLPFTGLADIGAAASNFYAVSARFILRQVSVFATAYTYSQGVAAVSQTALNTLTGGMAASSPFVVGGALTSLGTAYPATIDATFDVSVQFSAADSSVGCTPGLFDIQSLRRT